MRYLYSVLFYLALPGVFLRLLWRSRRNPLYRQRWAERLGFCPHQLEKCIWVHAVSVGETIAAIPLIKALKKQYPHLPLLVTNMTPTGAARVKAALGDSVLQAYIPYDTPDAVQRFLKRVNPIIGVIMETELWPNLFAACKKLNIRLIVTNARLSEKSAKGYKKIGSLTDGMFAAIYALASQGKEDAARFQVLGLSSDKIVVTGNLKFDIELPADLMKLSTLLREQLGDDRLIWIAGSTHPTEEEIVLEAHRSIIKTNPDALLILVPRHPDRFSAVADMVRAAGFTLARRSLNESAKTVNVYLGDTMGELLLMYSVSDVAFIAGSFAPIGGHNMLEAAVLHKPIIVGTQLFNFAEISDMLFAAKGMLQVRDAQGLSKTIINLFAHSDLREELGENAYQVVAENRGALQRQVDLVIKSCR